MTRSSELESVNLLDLAPVRVAKWEDLSDCVVVLRPRPKRRSIPPVWEWIRYLLSARRIRLDDIGSFVWDRLDGERKVVQVAHELREEFGPKVEPAEERVGRLIRMLRQEELVAYPGWDDSVLPTQAASN
jgi:hypothetical protein